MVKNSVPKDQVELTIGERHLVSIHCCERAAFKFGASALRDGDRRIRNVASLASDRIFSSTFAQPMLLVAGHLGRRAESDATNNSNDLLLESRRPTGEEPETGLTGRKDDECGNGDCGTIRQCRKPFQCHDRPSPRQQR